MVLSQIAVLPGHAASVSCRFFYDPIVGIQSIESNTPDSSNNPVLEILKDVLSNHFNIRKITPDMTVQAFETYLELIDPQRIFISKEDLAKLKYPVKSFFENIHLGWINGHTRPEYSALYAKTSDRMDAYIERFLHNDMFRMRILDRANEIQQLDNLNFSEARPEKTSDIEAKVIEYLAGRLSLFIQSTENNSKRKLRHADLAKLIRALRIEIETHKENVSEDSMTALIAKSFLSTFDAHTDMYLPEETRLSLDQSKNKRTSLGIMTGIHKDGMLLLQVFPGGVAEKSGLLKGDVVLAVEPVANSGKWYATKYLTMKEFTESLSGEPNSTYTVRVLRDSKEFTVSLVRQLTTSGERSVSPAEIRKTPVGDIMSVKLSIFSAGSSVALKKEIAKNKTADTKGIILDLRGNLGGSIVEMSDIVQLFAGRVNSMIVRDRNSVSVERSNVKDATVWDGPLVILVDHASASSSEALAAALQAHKRAIVVGGPVTFGKGSMQNYREINRTMYKYTTALFYSPTGQPLQWDGVKVDIPLVSTESVSNPFSERIQANSIKPMPLGGSTSGVSIKIPNLDAINKELAEKSKNRGLHEHAEGKSIKEIHTLNTDEAYRIVEDWLQLENNNKR